MHLIAPHHTDRAKLKTLNYGQQVFHQTNKKAHPSLSVKLYLNAQLQQQRPSSSSLQRLQHLLKNVPTHS